MRNLRAAIRMVLFVTSTLGIYGVWFVLRIFIPNKIYWRQVIFAAWTSAFTRISKMTIEVVGSPPNPPFFLVTNHLSYTDMAAIRAVVKGVFVAKAEVETWPLAGESAATWARSSSTAKPPRHSACR
ncbi:MAG: hypothetical protein IPG58_18975 [Acidobacteria bacterium]|nr:hypothetical protein [Acidobacteriota bacterium]